MENITVNGRVNSNKIWKMKKKLCSRVRDQATVKKDKMGNFITTENGIKQLYEKTYKDRLKHNTIKEEYKELEKNKLKLFKKRIEEASKRKTKPWTKQNLRSKLN